MKDEQTNNETETLENTVPRNDEADDLSRLKTENEQLKATIRLSNAHRQITAELAKAGARSPEVLFASMRDDLQFDDDGKVVNTAALIARLKARHPEQFSRVGRSGSIDAGTGRAARDLLDRAALAAMTPGEIAKLDWDEVRRALTRAE